MSFKQLRGIQLTLKENTFNVYKNYFNINFMPDQTKGKETTCKINLN